jgi:acyl-CoA thioesterase I
MIVDVKVSILFCLVLAWLGSAGCAKAPVATMAEPRVEVATTTASASTEVDNRKVLLVFGDSISEGYGLDPGLSYPSVMQRTLDAEHIAWRVVNQGVSGDTTEGGVARLASGVAVRPAIVLLELGGNDGLRGLPMEVTRSNLDKMIRAFQEVGAEVVLAGMTLPPNYGADYIKAFEKNYRDLAQERKVTLIPFLLSDMVTPDMRYFQRDGVHPTEEGAKIVSQTALRTLRPLLK